MDAVLDESPRATCSGRPQSGGSIESQGPIPWGYRLESSLAPDAWRTVTYQKGTWIIHMLRCWLGDEKFLKPCCATFAATIILISTDQFRELASPLLCACLAPIRISKIFFDNWVYGTGIPTVKLSYSWRPPRNYPEPLSGTLAQR